MIKFRFHSGSLDESLQTLIEVESLLELKDKIALLYPIPIQEIKCEYYGEDHRIPEWENTYIVSCLFKNVTRFMPVGFANANLE